MVYRFFWLILMALAGPCDAASITLAWEAAPSPQTGKDGKVYVIDGYKVGYGPAARTGDADTYTYPTVLDVGNLTQKALTVPDGKKLYFSAQAYGHTNDAAKAPGTSLYSNEVSKAFPPSPPSSVLLSRLGGWFIRDADAAVTSNHNFKIAWVQPTGPPVQFWLVNTEPTGMLWRGYIATTNPVVISRYGAAGPAVFMVAACNASGCSPWSSPVTVAVP
jgi:hypothetical protein